MKLAVTIDVEEEGLFTGRYLRGPASCENVDRLSLLDALFLEHDIKPTLLVSYQVAVNPYRLDKLRRLSEKWRGELGGHLHVWNTPPIMDTGPGLVSSQDMSKDVLAAKLDTLLTLLGKNGCRPTSFRMGRFNLGSNMLAILESAGVKVDSSICPMRRYHAGPNHLFAPADPYHPDRERPTVPGNSPILEVPLLIVPIIPDLGLYLEWVTDKCPAVGPQMAWLAQNVCSLSAMPLWMGLRRLKLAVSLHRRRGGQVTTLFFHSSELMPGGCPRHGSEADVSEFVKKMSSFFSWLRRDAGLRSVTLGELPVLGPWPGEPPPTIVPDPPTSQNY